MKLTQAISAGVVGAGTLNLIHESGRHWIPNAPHVDLLAMRAVGLYILKPLNKQIPLQTLRRWVFAGDLFSNSIYYAAVVGAGKQDSKSTWKRALLWGLGAGAATVALPSLIGMGNQKSRNFPLTAALTVVWYTLGSLAAAAVFNGARKL